MHNPVLVTDVGKSLGFYFSGKYNTFFSKTKCLASDEVKSKLNDLITFKITFFYFEPLKNRLQILFLVSLDSAAIFSISNLWESPFIVHIFTSIEI